MWWRRQRRDDRVDNLNAAIAHEERREYLQQLKARNDAEEQTRVRHEEREWQRKPWLLRPPPPDPVWPRTPEDGIVMRTGKRMVNNYVYDVQISARRWHYERDERRQAKQAAQAQAEQLRQQARERSRPRPSGSGSGSTEDPFIMTDETDRPQQPRRLWDDIRPPPEPEPGQYRARGRGR
jgi:hypothetical protein